MSGGAVKVTKPPSQKVVGPLAVTVGAERSGICTLFVYVLQPSASVTYAVNSIPDVQLVERTVTVLPSWLTTSPFIGFHEMFAHSPSIVAVTTPIVGQTEGLSTVIAGGLTMRSGICTLFA